METYWGVCYISSANRPVKRQRGALTTVPSWCSRWGSNPHGPGGPPTSKAGPSTDSGTRALLRNRPLGGFLFLFYWVILAPSV